MKTVSKKVLELLGDDYQLCESPSLRLEKYCTLDKNAKSHEISEVVACHDKHCSGYRPMAFRHPKAVEMIAMLQGNLIVNHTGGILENAGLCLDPFRNFPYIPGSAVKGVASHAAYMRWVEAGKLEDMAARIIAVFGFPCNHPEIDDQYRRTAHAETALSGQICFMQAVPQADVKLAMDVCTCHHPKYYQGQNDRATDDEAPNPQPFPVVKAGARFIFRLLPLRGCGDAVMEDAKGWLQDAMMFLGFGAKTAAGYGWFEYSDATSQAWLQQARDEEQKKLQEEQKAAEDRKKQEQKRRLEEEAKKKNKDREELKKSLSPEDWEHFLLSECDENQLKSKLAEFGQPKKLAAMPKEDKRAMIRVLKNEHVAVWNSICAIQKPAKNEPPWPRIVNELRRINKQEFGDKMP